jgi:hypothetical protein
MCSTREEAIREKTLGQLQGAQPTALDEREL